ncbi:MAG: hypothetical protein GXP54_10075 [Deltaproteobacteria bacterium]|nr:hypothetical protein [Deltaproteobacteria bacterium]
MERNGVMVPWVRTALGFAGLLAVAALGFFVSRGGLVDLKYAAMNPITDTHVRDRIAAGTMSPEEERTHLTRGSETAAETLYVPPVVVLKFLSMGFNTAFADVLFVRAHSYFLSHFFADRIFKWLDKYYEAIVGLDPDNPRVYLWAAQVVKYGQTIDDDTVRRADSFLEQGLKHFPEDWRLHMDLGFNLYFEFKGSTDAERSEARLKARDHFAIAAGLPGAPIDPNFVAELFERGHEEGMAIAYALQKYYEATDDQRKQLMRRISAISQVLAEGIQDEEKRWKAEFPFIPITLFSLVGDRLKSTPPPDILAAVREEKTVE